MYWQQLHGAGVLGSRVCNKCIDRLGRKQCLYCPPSQARGQPAVAGQVAVNQALLAAYGNLLQMGTGPAQIGQPHMCTVNPLQPIKTAVMPKRTRNLTGFKGVRCRDDGT